MIDGLGKIIEKSGLVLKFDKTYLSLFIEFYPFNK